MNIVLTSHNELKLKAVREVFPGTIIPFTATIPENPAQPFGVDKMGYSSALTCAINRLRPALISINETQYRYIISIENGVISLPGTEILYDICEVALLDISTKELFTTRYFTNRIKVSVPNPSSYLSIIQSKTDKSNSLGYDITFGELISKEFSTSKGNWMKIFGVDRVDQIKSSLKYMRTLLPENFQKIKKNIRTVTDYPQTGVVFQDMFSLFESEETLDTIVSKMADVCSQMNITKVTGPELRGCMLGILVAQKMGLGFIPIRKKGKLPPPTIEVSYKKEYGVDTFEINPDLFHSDDKVLVIDDILATGGSLKACITLIKRCATVAHCIVLADVPSLRSMAKDQMGENLYTVLIK